MRKSDAKWFFSTVKKTIYNFNMIEEGDCIAVGLSGGKDSFALLYILHHFYLQASMNFSIKAILVDLGWELDIERVKEVVQKFNIPLCIERTKIARIVFDVRKEKNPCALCAKMRHGALNIAARNLGANKVALGHHLDDVIHTFFLNLVYTGKMETFKPVTYLDRSRLTLIRPLIQIPEWTLAALVRREGLGPIENNCPVHGRTKRQEMAGILECFGRHYPYIKDRFRTAFINSPFWAKEE